MRVYFIFFIYFFPEVIVLTQGPRILQEGSFERKLKVLVLFLSDQKNWKATRPPPTLIFFPKSPGENFEIAILFSIVKKSNNYVFEDDLIPHRPGRRAASCELCPMFVYSIYYWEVYRRFRGDFFGGGSREGVTWEYLSMWNFSWGKGIFHEGGTGFPSII